VDHVGLDVTRDEPAEKTVLVAHGCTLASGIRRRRPDATRGDQVCDQELPVRPACEPDEPVARGTSVNAVMTTEGQSPAPALGRWGADEAVEQLYATHYQQLVRLSVLLVRDQGTAEEVVQDSFVAMHGRWRTLKEPHKGLAYLRQTVVNRSRSVLRHRGVQARHVPDPLPDERGADESTVARERRREVLDALQRLSTRQREVLVLRYYLDLDEAGIAEHLGISRGAVKSHASRGTSALRVLLEESHD
jgi:RNA polymerase sigma-70 factor (sigma-E family)